MAKHQIKIFEQSKMLNKTNESDLIDNITKKEFFNWMNNNGYSFDYLKEIFECKKISAYEQSKFNETIKRAKTEINIGFIDIVLLFEENFNKFNKILLMFDGETKYELKKELSKKYFVKLDENNIKQILG